MTSTIYQVLCNYYNTPELTKISNEGEHSIYWCKTNSLLSNAHRYLVVFVDRDVFFIGSTRPMNELNWKVFQARSLPESKKLTPHTYRASNRAPFNTQCSLLNRTTASTSYKLDTFPIEITLLHTKNDTFEYPDQGTLASALETFQTILTFI